MKIVFMGTPEFGATILKEIVKKHDVVLVVTQPDKMVGRKQEYVYNPVKKFAIEKNIEVFQPLKLTKEYQLIMDYDFDIIVTAAYGQMVPSKLLEYPKYNAINVHGSLLPKYRGGAPIQRSIINGDKETGITIMKMVKKMDAGDIILQKSILIDDLDNSDQLFVKLGDLGSKMIMEVLDDIEEKSGNITSIPQNEAEVSYAYNLTKEDELINFHKTALETYNQIRGLSTNPGGYFMIDGLVFKVYSSVISDEHGECGEIVNVSKKAFSIACKDKSITFKEIKPEGKGIIPVSDYLNGKGRNIILKGKNIYG